MTRGAGMPVNVPSSSSSGLNLWRIAAARMGDDLCRKLGIAGYPLQNTSDRENTKTF
jgi:hypothetical protein